jgi:hypothetical protein
MHIPAFLFAFATRGDSASAMRPVLQITPDMSIPAFLEAAAVLIDPLDAYFEKVRGVAAASEGMAAQGCVWNRNDVLLGTCGCWRT